MSDSVALTGEPLALDLVNTRPADGDLLTSPGELRAWLGLEADRFPEAAELAAGQLGAPELAAVREIRDHAARALDRARRGARPAAGDLAALNAAQRAAPAIGELGWDGEAVAVTHRRTGPARARLAAWLAEAAAGLLADPRVTEVRACEAEDCVLLFLPAHPRRRWCSAARCGNRVRVARHYRRHRPG
ncbi:CGNR zinc finger domain-containing protein [Streptomyces litchfieldiae]|uniref:CGNR zinc finger domain-containing protein n=1 Tax=Streptomyces litchfieldiae TaxID=3075543 RepID=A0ABU2MZ41_9ACTN|nr:CGNR zinc finger domain-containing protein [Streptomyces sp. DSM 44938]MDT0346907.1 CGNR zinc finger domain-containing protein [Streptomyces sp. DSM 44938]